MVINLIRVTICLTANTLCPEFISGVNMRFAYLRLQACNWWSTRRPRAGAWLCANRSNLH